MMPVVSDLQVPVTNSVFWISGPSQRQTRYPGPAAAQFVPRRAALCPPGESAGTSAPSVHYLGWRFIVDQKQESQVVA